VLSALDWQSAGFTTIFPHDIFRRSYSDGIPPLAAGGRFLLVSYVGTNGLSPSIGYFKYLLPVCRLVRLISALVFVS